MQQRIIRHLDELKHCGFVSEIDLNEDELRVLASRVCHDAERTPTRDSLGRLLLAAVGCAMRDYDERGFWHHFLTMLPASPGVSSARLRVRLQDALVEWDFLDAPRHGPHSTVTPILNQAGVTPRAMPSFANLLRDARERAGSWCAVYGWSLPTFLSFVADRSLGRALREFLYDEEGAGWRYTRAVARILEQWETGLLDADALGQLRGYRKDFWSDLHAHLGGTVVPRARGDRTTVPAPRLSFDPDHGLPVLMFAGEWVQRRSYRWEGRIVSRSVQHLTRASQLETGGVVACQTLAGGWITRGFPCWSPRTNPVAFFHHQRGYIPDPARGMPPGDYYYLSTDDHAAGPSAEICRSDFEEVPFEDGVDCRYWHLFADPGTDLRALGGGMVFGAEELLLDWAESGGLWGCVAEPAAVWSGTPRVTVRRLEDFREGRLALFLEVAGEPTCRLELPPGGSEGGVEMVLPVAVPARGRLWAEPLGRVKVAEEGRAAGAELSFILLPADCAVRWPGGLYSPQDEPVIELRGGSARASLDMPGCVPLPIPGHWRVPAQLKHVEGELQVGLVRVAVHGPIRRARFVLAAQSGARIIAGVDLSANAAVFTVTGLPMQQARIGLLGSDGAVQVSVDLLRAFDVHGRLEISSAAIRDAFRDLERIAAVGRLGIWDGVRWVDTGTTVVSNSALDAYLFDPNAAVDALVDRLELVALRRLIHEGSNARTLELAAGVGGEWSRHLQDGLSVVWSIAVVFGAKDPAEVPALVNAVEVPVEVGRTLRWVIAARQAATIGGEAELLKEYARLVWHPPHARWKRCLEDLADALRDRALLDPWLTEWRKEVDRRPQPSEYRSHLAMLPGGRELSKAYYFFNAQRAQDNQPLAFERLSEVRGQAAGIVRDLALVLEFLIHLRVRYDPETVATYDLPSDVHPRLIPIFACLRAAAGVTALPTQLCGGIPPSLLPLPEIDVAFLEGFSVGQAARESDPLFAPNERN